MGSAYVATQTISNPADQRVQVESLGQASQFISPGATVAAPASVAGSVGSYSTLEQRWSSVQQGLTGQEVRDLLSDQEAVAGSTLDRYTAVSDKALSGAIRALESLSAAQPLTPVSSMPAAQKADLSKWLPLAIAGGVVLLMLAGRRRGRT